MERSNEKLTDDQFSKRESGEPGGGQGRRDVVGDTPVYPISADNSPSDDALIRTPGEFGQRGRGLEGYYDHGESETYTLPPDEAGDDAAQASPGTSNTPVPGAGEETAYSGSVDVDQDPPSSGHSDITRF
ncbi:MAG: hypothetical protein JWP00_2910 [Chloroflexi bacterium]|jgi:hypothetical protein|nr:hypothetical protein [Chloroflexota bacterium]